MRKTLLIITLFLFAVLSMIAGISVFYPTDGVVIERLTLRFPTLSQLLKQPTVDAPDAIALGEPDMQPIAADSIILQDSVLHDTVHLAQPVGKPQIPKKTIVKHTSNTVHPILFPRNTNDSTPTCDSTYFDAFFAALEGADTTHVNIAHYGDSQIEEDRITVILRRRLQADFGGEGVGLVPPYQSVQTRTLQQRASHKPARNLVYFTNFKRKDGKYGPMGQVALIDSTYSLSVIPRGKKADRYSAHYFSRAMVLSSGIGDLSITLNDEEQIITQTMDSMQITTFELPDSTTQLTLDLVGKTNLYGVSLYHPIGVNIDNIAMRGSSGTIFRQINAEQLRGYFHITDTRMIILQFGGNRMPHIYDNAGIERYAKALRRQVEYFQSLAPEAVILFIGPSDMTTRRNGELMTYPLLPAVDKRLKQMAYEAGAAYWSMFDAMGGKGSMEQWVNTGYAFKDYIHFTRKGADKTANMLYDALMSAYHDYRQRQEVWVEEEIVKEETLVE